MPTSSALRRDSLSELQWHTYVSQVLHARSQCMHLSEKQVIQHLTSASQQAAPHIAAAQECASNPYCTVRTWLDCIRDFYFTNGQFRHNIEVGWREYDATTASDFNDIIHHIRTYYRLIFLDYAHMQGELTRLHFAWILFSKMQELMNPTCTSNLSSILRSFFPLSDLLSKMSGQLKPARQQCMESANKIATEFISWSIQQLQEVKENANTARIYTPAVSSRQIDYALLHKSKFRTHDHQQRQDRDKKQRLDLKAAAAALPPPPSSNKHQRLQSGQKRTHNQSRGGATKESTVTRYHVPELKEHLNCDDPVVFIKWIHQITKDPQFDPKLKTRLLKECAGDDSSLHVNLASAPNQLPAHVDPTAMGICKAQLRHYFLFQHKQCLICPVDKSNPAAVNHTAGECGTLRAILSPDQHLKITRDPFNKDNNVTILPPGWNIPDSKKNRYDPTRKGPPPKRGRTDHNIR